MSERNKKRIKLLPHLLEYLNFDQEFDNTGFIESFRVERKTLNWKEYIKVNISNYILKSKNTGDAAVKNKNQAI